MRRRWAWAKPASRSCDGQVPAGKPGRNIAADPGISQRVVEAHRAAIMRATGSRLLPGLALPGLARPAVAVAATKPEAKR